MIQDLETTMLAQTNKNPGQQKDKKQKYLDNWVYSS